MTDIRWGIIGVGDVTEVKSGPGFQKAKHSQLVAVMRRNGDLARDFAVRHGVPRWYDAGQALIDDDEVDAVYIATPPHVHKEYTLMAAAAGKPVFVEKPMALDYAECEEMIAACKEAAVPLWVAYYRRMLPRFVTIKHLIETDSIGDIRSVAVTLRKRLGEDDAQVPWRVQPDIAGGGRFLDMGVHTLDFLDYILGPIQSVTGYATNQAGLYPAEDSVVSSFVFESGVTGMGMWCFASPDELDETVIVGTRGTITFSSFDTRAFTMETDEGIETFEIANPPHVHQPLIQTIVDELTGAGECPSTGESAARTTWVADQILQSYREQKREA